MVPNAKVSRAAIPNILAMCLTVEGDESNCVYEPDAFGLAGSAGFLPTCASQPQDVSSCRSATPVGKQPGLPCYFA